MKASGACCGSSLSVPSSRGAQLDVLPQRERVLDLALVRSLDRAQAERVAIPLRRLFAGGGDGVHGKDAAHEDDTRHEAVDARRELERAHVVAEVFAVA